MHLFEEGEFFRVVKTVTYNVIEDVRNAAIVQVYKTLEFMTNISILRDNAVRNCTITKPVKLKWTTGALRSEVLYSNESFSQTSKYWHFWMFHKCDAINTFE